MVIQHLEISELDQLPTDPSAYPIVMMVHVDLPEIIKTRASSTDATAEEYAQVLREGGELPPGEAVFDGGRILIWDGAIRRQAYRLVGRRYFSVQIARGTEAEAYRKAYKANAEHGLRRTREDKRRIVLLALSREGGAKISARELARMCAVSHTYASKRRKEYLASLPDTQDAGRVKVTRKGRTYTMDTGGIGGGASKASSREDAPQKDRSPEIEHPRPAPAGEPQTDPSASRTCTEKEGTPPPPPVPDHLWRKSFKALLKGQTSESLSWALDEIKERLKSSAPAEILAWRGPSQVNGEMIRVVIGSLGTTSNNAKTGDMTQVAILADAAPPWAAAKTGQDRANCGDCKHKLSELSTCYVYGDEVIQYRGMWTRTDSQEADFHAALEAIRRADKPVRIGAYGDPAAVPFEVIEKIVEASKDTNGRPRYTMYTHRWRECDQRYRDLALASVDTEVEYLEAQSMGWTTFRVAPTGDKALEGEHECLHAIAARREISVECRDCLGCRPGVQSKYIHVHGTPRKRRDFDQFSLNGHESLKTA